MLHLPGRSTTSSPKELKLDRASFFTATTSLLSGLLGLLALGFSQVGIFHPFLGLSLLAASTVLGFITHCIGHARRTLGEKQKD